VQVTDGSALLIELSVELRKLSFQALGELLSVLLQKMRNCQWKGDFFLEFKLVDLL